MASPTSFYLDQAASCAESAKAAILPNLREKFLRSQAVWQELADRQIKTLAARTERERQAQSTD